MAGPYSAALQAQRDGRGLGSQHTCVCVYVCVCVCVCVCVWWGVIFQYDKNSTRSHCTSGEDGQGIVSAFSVQFSSVQSLSYV